MSDWYRGPAADLVEKARLDAVREAERWADEEHDDPEGDPCPDCGALMAPPLWDHQRQFCHACETNWD